MRETRLNVTTQLDAQAHVPTTFHRWLTALSDKSVELCQAEQGDPTESGRWNFSNHADEALRAPFFAKISSLSERENKRSETEKKRV
jgi:hypothetical protein